MDTRDEPVCRFCRSRKVGEHNLAPYGLCASCAPVYANADGSNTSLFGAQGVQGPYHVHDENCTGAYGTTMGGCERTNHSPSDEFIKSCMGV